MKKIGEVKEERSAAGDARSDRRTFTAGVGVGLLALALLVPVFQPPARAAQEKKGLPPLIDRQMFFGNPEISGAQISPDGKYIAFVKPLDGTRNIWVKGVDEPFDKARPLTNDTKRPIPGYFWSRDGRYVLFVQDQGGNENYNVYAVDPSAKLEEGQQVPAARNLTDAEGVRAIIFRVPETEPDALYIGLNDREPAWHDLYKVTISTGERTLVRKNTERITSWIFDLKDNLRLATRAAEDGSTEILRVDGDKFEKVYECSVFESCGIARFHKDGKRAYMVTNKGDDVNLVRLVLFDPQTGKTEFVESDPEKRVDLGGTSFSEVTDELIATVYVDDRTRIYWKDKGFKADYEHLKKQLGKDMDLGFNSSTKDERLWLVSASSDTEPGKVVLYDRKTRKVTPQYTVRDELPREHLAPMKAIRYKSSDGLEIPAFLTLPKGVEAKNLPLIINPHGGPWARDTWGYDTFAQFLANRGYAVLQPNFRASTGYGKEFLNAGNNEWGQKMQDDLTWGAKHLIAEGIVDPKRVGIMGGSYGGYATLAGLTFTPDLYAAGVSIVGPSNLITLLDSIPPYWEPIRKLFHERMGDPSTPEGRAQLERQSPLNSADKITTPLLVVQGANDPRVKKAESDQIVVALRERGFPVAYLVAPDEGHGFARPVNNMAMIVEVEKFLAKHLGGRYQESMKEDVAKRLEEITVDVKSVEMPRKIDATAVGVPKPAMDLEPATATYKGTIEVAGQTINMDIESKIVEENGAWVVTETATTPMGPISDRTVLEKGTLVLRKRSVKQGPVTIDVTVADKKATGTMTVNGQERPIDVELEGALFADGAGAHEVMAHLPLKEGYTATFRNLDLQTGKVKVMQLEVMGTEEVTVPAGTFTAFKVKVLSPEDGSETWLWIDTTSRQVVKARATVPRMNGAVITTELASR